MTPTRDAQTAPCRRIGPDRQPSATLRALARRADPADHDRRWTPDEAIPAESGLAEAYGVSLGTMRKALQQLVDEGLLERHQGSGTFVRRARFDRSLFRFFRHGAMAPSATAPSRPAGSCGARS